MTNTILTKTCKDCGISKPTTGFYPCNIGKPALRARCIQCENKTRYNSWKQRADIKSHNATRRAQDLIIKKEVMGKYGGFCQCCGEKELKFLAIDHINNDGNKHRKLIGMSGGIAFYRWLKRNKYPPQFQVLCHNCNFAKGRWGRCPHQDILEKN
jgi:hypothetical protein